MFEHERSASIATFAATLSEGLRGGFALSTGSRTHPWLYSGIPTGLVSRGFIPGISAGLVTRGFIPASLQDWSLAALFRHLCGIGHILRRRG
jgi:hypothetical protein